MKKGYWPIIIAMGFGISIAAIDCAAKFTAEKAHSIKKLQEKEAIFATCSAQHPGATQAVLDERIACVTRSDVFSEERNILRSRLTYCQKFSPVFGNETIRGTKVDALVRCLGESTYCPAWKTPSEIDQCRNTAAVSDTEKNTQLQRRLANLCGAAAPNSVEGFTQCMFYYLDLELVRRQTSEFANGDKGNGPKSFEEQWENFESRNQLSFYQVPLAEGSLTSEVVSLAMQWVKFGFKLGFLYAVALILGTGFISVLKKVNLSSATAYKKFLANELRSFRKDSHEKSLLQKGATAAVAGTLILTLGINITVNGVRYFESTRAEKGVAAEQSTALLIALQQNQTDLRAMIARGDCLQTSVDALASRISSLDPILQDIRDGRVTQKSILDQVVGNQGLIKNLGDQNQKVIQGLSETNRILGGASKKVAEPDSILGQLITITGLLQGFENRLSATPPNPRTVSEEVYGIH